MVAKKYFTKEEKLAARRIQRLKGRAKCLHGERLEPLISKCATCNNEIISYYKVPKTYCDNCLHIRTIEKQRVVRGTPLKDRAGNFEDLVGQKFGTLTVIEFAGISRQGNACWKCICNCNRPGCKGIIISNASNLKGHPQRTCGGSYRYGRKICRLCGMGFYANNGAKIYCPECAPYVCKIRESSKRAEYNGLKWTLTDRQAYNILKDAICYYYNKKDECFNKDNSHSDIRLGFDRVDNSLGYIPGNVVACCWHHNKVKSNITKHQILKINDFFNSRKLDDGLVEIPIIQARF